MAKGGRPKKADGERGTRQIRVFEDIADMLGWIQYFEEQSAGKSTSIAQLIDPHLRPVVTAMYERYRAAVEAIKAGERVALEAAAAAKKPKPGR